MVRLANAARAVDHARCGQIRAGDELHQLIDGDFRVVEQGDTAVDHLAEIVRRDVGGHADRDTGGTVDQQIREARGQYGRFGLGLIVVGDEIDRILIEVRQQFVCQAGHAHFRIAHGGGGIAVYGTEVALTVHQHVTHGKRLGQAHDRVIYGRVTVGVVLAHHIAYHACRFLVRLVPVVVELVHRVEHPPVHRFQPVTYVGKRTADNHAHGVIEVRLAHLVFEVYGDDFTGGIGHQAARWQCLPEAVTWAASGGRKALLEQGVTKRLG